MNRVFYNPRGGFNLRPSGRPSSQVRRLPDPERLMLPLRSRRFHFWAVSVEEGQAVGAGDVLARDPSNGAVPLLAPRAGRVRLAEVPGHIVVETAPGAECAPSATGGRAADEASPEQIRARLVDLGAWQWMHDAATMELPDPAVAPGAVIVSTVRYEPYLARGSVLLDGALPEFAQGLTAVQHLLDYQPIYLAVPDVDTRLMDSLRESLRGHAFVEIVGVPMRYPLAHFALLARRLGVARRTGRPVWATWVEGVLAIARAARWGRPSLDRIVSIGGPGAAEPVHASVPVGYPVERIVEQFAAEGPVRALSGGLFTGEVFGPERRGIDAECLGVTLIAENRHRPFWEFLRPRRRSYSRAYLARAESGAATTTLHGSERACIACDLCREVCPADLIPQILHKRIRADDLEEARRLGISYCIGCGLCSYVCPSKIELRAQFVETQRRMAAERESGEARA